VSEQFNGVTLSAVHSFAFPFVHSPIRPTYMSSPPSSSTPLLMYSTPSSTSDHCSISGIVQLSHLAIPSLSPFVRHSHSGARGFWIRSVSSFIRRRFFSFGVKYVIFTLYFTFSPEHSAPKQTLEKTGPWYLSLSFRIYPRPAVGNWVVWFFRYRSTPLFVVMGIRPPKKSEMMFY
jgi:hypothetical protein